MRFEAIKKEKMQCCNGFLRGKKKIKERDRVKIELVLLCLYF